MTETGLDGKRADGPDKAAWRDLLGYVRPHRWAVLLGGALLLVGSVIGFIEPLVVKVLMDALERDETILDQLILLTGAVIGGGVVTAFGYYFLGRSAESVVRDSRHRLVGRILWLRIPHSAKFQPGELMSRVTADTTLLREVVSQALVDSVRGVLMSVAILVMMFVLEPVLMLVTFGVLLVAGLMIGFIVPFFSRYNTRIQEAIGEMSTTLERALGAFRTVKATGSEFHEEGKIVSAADHAWKFGVRLAALHGIIGAGATLAIHVSFLAVLGVGGARVASGEIAIGTLIAFLLYLFYLLDPLTSIIEAASNLSAGAAAAHRIREVQRLDVEPRDEGEAEQTGQDEQTPVSVRFDNVFFRYPDTVAVVHKGVSFELPPGGVTAVVGPSGAGKSTLFSLLERFYEPDSGKILMDGQDITQWPLRRLRASIGYVEQDAPVLAGTLRENLLIGVPEASEKTIMRALERTRLDGLVARLPDGLDTSIGHRGNTLSGGERQRVAVARSLLRRPRLLLLDEVTSQLDAVNELALRDAIVEAGREFTVIVVAHRLSTVVQADRIVVMDAGQVRAIGTHEELVAADPLYRELATTQLLVAEDLGDDEELATAKPSAR